MDDHYKNISMRKILILAVKGSQPDYKHMDVPEVKACGQYFDQQGRWQWRSDVIDGYSNDLLYKIIELINYEQISVDNR